MSKKAWFYIGFFAILLTVYYAFAMRGKDFYASPLAVINSQVPPFRFTDQDGKEITQAITDEKVYVAEYFFTTCKGICPKMNANMRRVFDAYRNEKDFLILSHTCMPETDSVPVLKAYERKMINGKIGKGKDGSYILTPISDSTAPNANWHFLTGSKEALYRMARTGYIIDNQKPDSSQNIADQFIHTQFFALVDRNRRVRGIYDGLKNKEVEKLISDVQELLKEKIDHKRFMDGFTTDPL